MSVLRSRNVAFLSAVACILVSVAVCVDAFLLVTLWTLSLAFRQGPAPLSSRLGAGMVIYLTMFQLVASGVIARLLTQPFARRARRVFDALTLAAAALVLYAGIVEGGGMLAIAVILAAGAGWAILRAREAWLRGLAFLWTGAVLFVLGWAATSVESGPVALWSGCAIVAGLVAWIAARAHPAVGGLRLDGPR